MEKNLTTPYMDMVTSKMHIMDAQKHFGRLRDMLAEWSNDSGDLVNGSALLFPDFPPKKDHIYDKLYEKSSDETEVAALLSIILTGLLAVVERQLADQLPGGKFYNVDDRVRKETQSMPLHNLSSENLFARLDRLQKNMPNANTVTMEGIILWSHNKTYAYLNSLELKEKDALIQKARQKSPQILKAYRERKEMIRNKYREQLQEKQKQKLAKDRRTAERKDKIVDDISSQEGACKSREELELNIVNMTEKETFSYLQAQIRYQKNIHGIKKGTEKLDYQFQHKGKRFTAEQLKQNLVKILECENGHDQEATPITPANPEKKEEKLTALKRKLTDKIGNQRKQRKQ
ncbi:uncharacterized protein [Ptychodera flava]|uniref:uncharacterized protein n=1 Tax=Ptychodera flava TaxID=63121 RepID=UPI003969D632